MDNIQTDQNMAGDQSAQVSATQLNDLLAQAREMGQEIEKNAEESKKEMNDLEERVDASVKNINQACSDLDAVDREAVDELDGLVLEEAEDLATE